MAAAYAFHIARNHPFVDGNKRAATGAMIAFLSDNGWVFEAEVDVAEREILELAAGGREKAAFTAWLVGHCRQKPSMELRDFFRTIDGKVFIEKLSELRRNDTNGIRATWLEMREVVPGLTNLIVAYHDAKTMGNEKAADTSLAYADMLSLLVRVAEDMGYEW